MSTVGLPGRTLTRVSLLVLLVTLVACASPTVRRQPTPTPASTPSPPAPTVTAGPFPSPLTGLLGPMPTHCPAVPPLATLSIDATFGGGFVGGVVFTGRSPVWNQGINTGASQQLVVNPTSYPSTKVMWIVGPNYHQPVILSGHELSTGAPVWFDLGNSPGNSMTRAVLDPAAPNRGSTNNASGHWNIWGIILYFFTAGCYQIDAAWAGGSWQVVVAVGS